MVVAAFLLRRIVRLVLTLLTVSFATFALLQLAPGSFTGIQATGNAATGLATVGTVASQSELQTRYGDQVSYWHQYWTWLSHAVQGDLSPSYKYPSMTVSEIIGQAFPVSASLALLALALALMVAIPVGVFAAAKKDKAWDRGTMFVLTTGHALPNYLAAICLVIVFAVDLHWFPTSGWDSPLNLVLPVIALSIAPAGILARYVRSSVIETLREEYVVAARGKGGPPWTVLRRHVLRNSLIPLVTVAAPQLASLMAGTIFVETIFGIPGLGSYFTIAARSRDMPLMMGITVFFALLIVGTNLVADMLYGLLDPRTRIHLGLGSKPRDESPMVTRRLRADWRHRTSTEAMPAGDIVGDRARGV